MVSFTGSNSAVRYPPPGMVNQRSEMCIRDRADAATVDGDHAGPTAVAVTSAAPGAAPLGGGSPQGGVTSDTVLVVDDDVSTRASLLAVLAGAGIAAIGAASAEQALAFHADSGPALVVIDYLLPDRNGLDLAQALKERDPTLPILLLSLIHI